MTRAPTVTPARSMATPQLPVSSRALAGSESAPELHQGVYSLEDVEALLKASVSALSRHGGRHAPQDLPTDDPFKLPKIHDGVQAPPLTAAVDAWATVRSALQDVDDAGVRAALATLEGMHVALDGKESAAKVATGAGVDADGGCGAVAALASVQRAVILQSHVHQVRRRRLSLCEL